METTEDIGIRFIEFYINANTISNILYEYGESISKERFLCLLHEMEVG